MDQVQELKSRVAVIDCGTNTFNLLIAETVNGGSWTPVFKNKIPVKLAPSHTTGLIGKNRFARGVDALYSHKNNLINMDVDAYAIYATSAIRDSGNGPEFVEHVKKELALEIRVICGDEEAELIFEGVKQTLCGNEETFVIVDIGGGSVEFIIANQDGPLWQKSLALGVSRLKGKFQPDDPLPEDTVMQVQKYLDDELDDVFERIHSLNVQTLIGSSGSFDTLEQMIAIAKGIKRQVPGSQNSELDLVYFDELKNKLLKANLFERTAMPGMLPMRADMINFAVIFIDLILKKGGIKHMLHCNYALKEGAIQRLINELNQIETLS